MQQNITNKSFRQQDLKESLEDKQKKAALKHDIGAWLFSILSTFTIQEFKKTVRQMKTTPSLLEFNNKVTDIRDKYKQLLNMFTTKQQSYATKPFMYGISFDQGIDIQEGESKQINVLQIEIDAINTKTVNVTQNIPDETQYKSFINLISLVLQGTQTNTKFLEKIQEEEKWAKTVLEVTQSIATSNNAQQTVDESDQLILDDGRQSEVDEDDNIIPPQPLLTKRKRDFKNEDKTKK